MQSELKVAVRDLIISDPFLQFFDFHRIFHPTYFFFRHRDRIFHSYSDHISTHYFTMIYMLWVLSNLMISVSSPLLRKKFREIDAIHITLFINLLLIFFEIRAYIDFNVQKILQDDSRNHYCLVSFAKILQEITF